MQAKNERNNFPNFGPKWTIVYDMVVKRFSETIFILGTVFVSLFCLFCFEIDFFLQQIYLSIYQYVKLTLMLYKLCRVPNCIIESSMMWGRQLCFHVFAWTERKWNKQRTFGIWIPKKKTRNWLLFRVTTLLHISECKKLLWINSPFARIQNRLSLVNTKINISLFMNIHRNQ